MPGTHTTMDASPSAVLSGGDQHNPPTAAAVAEFEGSPQLPTHEATSLASRARQQRAAKKSLPTRQKTLQPLEAANVPDALLTLETVAALCGQCTRTIQRRQKEGVLGDLVRLAPNSVRLRARNVTAWLASQGPMPMPPGHKTPR